MVNTLNEKELLLLISKGNTVAFRRIFDQYRDKIYSFAMYLTNTDFLAEEITQEVFIRIWSARDKLPDIVFFNSYLRVIARNVACNHLKRFALEKLVMGKIMAEENSQETPLENRENKEEFDTIIKITNCVIENLPPQQKKAFILHYKYRMKNSQIAELMNLSVYTVKEYLKNAIRSVRHNLSDKISILTLVALIIFFE
ncbi:MAG: sigma-70 family RNA polymerase sigma factor [Bacteroidales bacterium]|nr:sigma-70 family RNA polymerase sigma factor [Bacteroidales bacterium]MDD3990455.1 sigma-70 family RNA polymerase sigma factor [Bacteroidales bacterium]MDD4639603.1 sigma-70 family RNA polymerase sigma factor [Bacteroidales bacterium]